MKTFKMLMDCDSQVMFYRRVKDRRYHVIDLKDLFDYCGESEAKEMGGRYSVDLQEVDLDVIIDNRLNAAIESCGRAGLELTDLDLVEVLIQYGCGTPLHSVTSFNRKQAIQACKAESKALDDSERYEQAMTRPVNRLGSTAREYGQGDLHSALTRGLIQGHAQKIVQYCVHFSEIPSDDPIAFMSGYTDSLAGRGKADPGEDTLAPAYLEGFKRGIAVRSGIAKPVEGIKQI